MSKGQPALNQEFDYYCPEFSRFVATLVNPGYLSYNEILSEAVQHVEGELGKRFAKHTTNLVKRMYDRSLADQRNWPDRTDCDLLDRAFKSIEEYNVIAKQHYWCCKECAAAAIDDEMHDRIATYGEHVNGFVYYSQSDTAAAVSDYELRLSFASVDYDVQRTLWLGAILLSELSAHGLRASWTGEVNEPIVVQMEYKRRRKPELRIPFAPLLSKTKVATGTVHYIRNREIDPVLLMSNSAFTAEERNLLGSWPALFQAHMRSDRPASVRLNGRELMLMRECLQLKRKFIERHRRPALASELAEILGVHILVIMAVGELLQFHLSELI